MNNKNQTKTAEAGQNSLTQKQIDVLTLIAKESGNVDAHIARPKGISADVFNALKKKELVGAHSKFVWVTKKAEFIFATPQTPVAPAPAKPTPAARPTPPAKKPLAKQSDTLNWAFRRLRRQALIYFGQNLVRDGLKGNIKELRRDLESTDETYTALREKVELLVENDNKLHGTWGAFMDHFFGHVIHPGSQKA